MRLADRGAQRAQSILAERLVELASGLSPAHEILPILIERPDHVLVVPGEQVLNESLGARNGLRHSKAEAPETGDDALAHRRVARECCAGRGGQPVDSQGWLVAGELGDALGHAGADLDVKLALRRKSGRAESGERGEDLVEPAVLALVIRASW